MWWSHLKQFIALNNKASGFEGFDLISGLKTGEGVVFCPLVLGICDSEEGEKICQFGREYIII